MIRFARSYEFSVLSTPHRWCLRFVRLPFPPKVRSFPSSLLLRSRHDSSTDDAAGADHSGERSGLRDFSRREGFQGRIFQTGSLIRRDRATRARRRGMWIVTVSSLRYVCVRLRHLTLDFLSSGSSRPLLLFFPDDGERFPRRRVSRARPEDGTRGFEAPTRRKDRRRGERRATGSGFLSSRARVRRENARLLVSSEATANTRNAHVRYLSSLARCST